MLTMSNILYKIARSIFFGGVPERPKGADCKSAGSAFGGSNPPPSTITSGKALKISTSLCKNVGGGFEPIRGSKKSPGTIFINEAEQSEEALTRRAEDRMFGVILAPGRL
jgi:hypothetical protein